MSSSKSQNPVGTQPAMSAPAQNDKSVVFTNSSDAKISIAILAGGQSRRMGQDKATLLLNGKMMLIYLLEKLPPQLSVFLISNTQKKHEIFELPMHSDILPDKGAPGGIYTALHHSKTTWTLCLACDMPLIKPELLQHLITQIDTTSAAAIVPVVEERYQPLCTLYHQRCKTIFYDHLHHIEKIPPIHSILDKLALKICDEHTLQQYDPDLRSFININTPDDLRYAEKLLDAAAQ